MATTADEIVGAESPHPASEKRTAAQVIDRWIYVIMAAFFVVTALAGFIPDSIGKVMAIRAGFQPPFPIVLHVHAVLMGSWLLLLLTQTTLIATGRRAYHKQLGVAGTFLAPAMVATGFVLVPTMVSMNWGLIAAAPPEALEWGAERTRMFLTSLVAIQIMAGILFGTFVAWAMLVRNRDAGMHKRLMILATVIPLSAAIDRITWLPQSYPESPLSPLGWPVLWIMPMFLWDLYRQRRVHKAYIAWAALYVPAGTIAYLLWWWPPWMALVRQMLGLS